MTINFNFSWLFQLKIYFCKKLNPNSIMYWTLELASYLSDAPWPATKDELIDYAIRSGGEPSSYWRRRRLLRFYRGNMAGLPHRRWLSVEWRRILIINLKHRKKSHPIGYEAFFLLKTQVIKSVKPFEFFEYLRFFCDTLHRRFYFCTWA